MEINMKVRKQSLVDWKVLNGAGTHVAWIGKVKLGYEVTFSGRSSEPYLFPRFNDAKQFAIKHA